MTATATYMHDILRRGRVPMAPLEYDVPWDDQPRRYKVYPGTQSIALPRHAPAVDRTLGYALGCPGRERSGDFDLASLGSMLWHSYGLSGRRAAVHRNDDVPAMPWYDRAVWSRGTASGGGLYPLEIYLVTSGEQGLVPGIYNWNSARHSLSRLATGNYVGRIQDSLGPHATGAGSYLLLSIKFWQNAFKYNSFSPHVTAMDIGTVLATWELWCRNQGLPLRANLWFDEHELNDLLGLDGYAESTVSVVPVPMGGTTGGSGRHSRTTRHEAHEKSRAPRSFEVIDDIQSEILAAAAADNPWQVPPPPPKDPGRGVADSAPRVVLPAQPLGEMPLREALLRRRSSFGRFTADPPISQGDLRNVLDAVNAANDGFGVTGELPDGLVRTWVCATNVADVAQGIYRYDRSTGELAQTLEAGLELFLQGNYFLRNYDMARIAAVIVLTARPGQIIDHYGPRGLRLQNAAIGAATQYGYLAAAARGLGCGAALGFDNTSYGEAFGTASLEADDATAEWPMLILMVGHEDTVGAELHLRLAEENAR
ncbi:SagB family peptide dehydrogenase [Ornithinimicrobium sp. F0845]|uniref:SagB family peptide dehydrogenase n=1 Tax=Ornithinimicrobium sp. F0845 TaxID=2926412 RepID=UPI001FF3DEE2|nr:SagB family peptide dehydrogenase [Ornithinimicrobium sp. F0845]MCK0112066.1 SagB family peptide dehydrogenase [Ornithinimicrobium sp. F0845]